MTSNGNYAILHLACGRGGTGRRVRLRGVWETVWVQVPSTAPKKMTCTFIVQVFFLQGSKGLERDVKKTARCAVFSPRRDSNRVSGAKKGVRNACARRVAEQVPSTAPTEKTILLSSFFSFYRVLSFLFFDIMFYFVLLSSTFHGINSYISFKFLLQKCLECVLLHL